MGVGGEGDGRAERSGAQRTLGRLATGCLVSELGGRVGRGPAPGVVPLLATGSNPGKATEFFQLKQGAT